MTSYQYSRVTYAWLYSFLYKKVWNMTDIDLDRWKLYNV